MYCSHTNIATLDPIECFNRYWYKSQPGQFQGQLPFLLSLIYNPALYVQNYTLYNIYMLRLY